MAGSISASPTYALTPSAKKQILPTNYITDFDFLNQYLPDIYEREFARYGNRTIASLLRLQSAELPCNSDLIKWAEQGRLHTKYVDVDTVAIAGADTAVWTVNDAGLTVNFRVNQTVMISANATNTFDKAIITAVDTTANTFTVAYYAAGGQTIAAGATCTVFVYGSEFKKGVVGMDGSLEAESEFFENKPIIIKDEYVVSGSDMAQIGWVEITGEDSPNGYYWYMKSEHDTRKRYEDYLEMSMIEGVKAETGSGALTYLTNANATNAQPGAAGTQGFFAAIEERGNVWGGGNPEAIADYDAIIQRLDKQGAIAENMIYMDRKFSLDTDDMLASMNSYGANGSSYGLFDNDENMALNLGFKAFKRGGYEFYKSDWKYLNEPTLRGGIVGGAVNGVLIPSGSTTVYDEILGEKVTRPFLHIRYRASDTVNRKFETWVTGGAGGAKTSSLDAMEVHFLSERALCTLGANNFFLFKD